MVTQKLSVTLYFVNLHNRLKYVHLARSQSTADDYCSPSLPLEVSQSHDPGFHPDPEYEEIKNVYQTQWCGKRASGEAGGKEGYKLTECLAYAASTV